MTPQDPRSGELAVEMVPLADLRPHPRNYRDHPEEQVAHLIESIREHGIFRQILVARDGTILAGHGVARACGRIGMEAVPVSCLDLDPEDPRALKILVADNESSRLAEDSEADLAGLLEEINDSLGLLGTGHTEESLAELMASLEVPPLPDPGPQREPVLAAEHLVEIQCTAEALAAFRPTLDQWGKRAGCTVNIS
jgi:ParB-like chromosome segregation protein Spo0J